MQKEGLHELLALARSIVKKASREILNDFDHMQQVYQCFQRDVKIIADNFVNLILI